MPGMKVQCYVFSIYRRVVSGYIGSLWKISTSRGLHCKSQGLTTQYKLKYEHTCIYLTSFSKMRMDLAAQIRFKEVIVAVASCLSARYC